MSNGTTTRLTSLLTSLTFATLVFACDPPAERPSQAPIAKAPTPIVVTRSTPGFSPNGGLSPEQVRSVVIAHTGALRACYEIEAQKNSELRGTVTVAWQIDESGVVQSASVVGSTLGNHAMEDCVLRQVNSLRFPSSDAKTTVAAYPFRFGVP